jgi:hypothetical protein
MPAASDFLSLLAALRASLSSPASRARSASYAARRLARVGDDVALRRPVRPRPRREPRGDLERQRRLARAAREVAVGAAREVRGVHQLGEHRRRPRHRLPRLARGLRLPLRGGELRDEEIELQIRIAADVAVVADAQRVRPRAQVVRGQVRHPRDVVGELQVDLIDRQVVDPDLHARALGEVGDDRGHRGLLAGRRGSARRRDERGGKEDAGLAGLAGHAG